jgi:hypothetical protein
LFLLNLLSLLQDFDRIVLDEVVLEVARMFGEELVPGQPPTKGKQLVNFIIREYGMKYKIFHEQVLIKSSRNETLVLSIFNLKVLPSYYYFLFYQH